MFKKYQIKEFQKVLKCNVLKVNANSKNKLNKVFEDDEKFYFSDGARIFATEKFELDGKFSVEKNGDMVKSLKSFFSPIKNYDNYIVVNTKDIKELYNQIKENGIKKDRIGEYPVEFELKTTNGKVKAWFNLLILLPIANLFGSENVSIKLYFDKENSCAPFYCKGDGWDYLFLGMKRCINAPLKLDYIVEYNA